MLNNQPQPHSIHINATYEKNLLGIVLSDANYAHSILPYLLEEDFAIFEHKKLFLILEKLFNTNSSINNESVLNLAQKTNEKSITNLLLIDIYTNAGIPSNIQIYLEELIRLTKLRSIEIKIIELQNKLSRLDKNLDPDAIALEMQKLLVDIDRAKNGEDFLTAKSVSDEYYND